jgi:uncharacterized iron-regulated membrane protein
VPLFLVIISGVVLSYPWANDLLYKITGSEPPPRRSASANTTRGGDSSSREEQSEVSTAGMNQLWARALQQVPGWQVITLRLPPSPGKSLTFAIEQGSKGRVDLRSQLVLDRASAEVVRWENFESLNAGRRLRSWLRFVHTGEAGGFLGQTVAGIASAGAAVLAFTGLMLAFRRFRSWRGRGRPTQVEVEREKTLVYG